MRRLFTLFALCLLLPLPACDWIQYSFMNSIPFKGDPKKNPTVDVYLAIDGLPYSSVSEVQKQGAFSGRNWKLAKFVSMFPSTSDASWTRILHSAPLEGYEYTYFDPDKDAVANKGYLGLIKHIVPTLMDGISLEAPYLKAFDFRANGYFHSVGVYHDTFANLAETLDNLFFLLEGRAETRSTFSAYLYEIDAMGHIFEKADVLEALRIIHKKIERFKELHPERKFRFTILSDHGIDFVKVDPNNLVVFSEEMKKVGVEPVDSLKGKNPRGSVFAVPIDHVRLTYLTFHTLPELTEEVASRLSQLPQVDVAVAKIPNSSAQHFKYFTSSSNWYGIWENGKPVLRFGFVPASNQYILDPSENFARFGIELSSTDSEQLIISDDELFPKTKHSPYPDLFYKVRSVFSNTLQKYPGDVLVSLRPGYVSQGFKLPWGGKDFSLAGFHGSLLDSGCLGTLLTEERDLPDVVRSDTFLEMFPGMRRNMEEKGMKIFEGDSNAHLHYR